MDKIIMDKIILIFYIDIGGLSRQRAQEGLNSIAKMLEKDAENEPILTFIMPIKNGDSRVECINPKLVSEEEYGNAKEVLERNQKTLDDLLKIGDKDVG